MYNYVKSILYTIGIFFAIMFVLNFTYPILKLLIVEDLVFIAVIIIVVIGLNLFFYFEYMDKLKEINITINKLNLKIEELKNK